MSEADHEVRPSAVIDGDPQGATTAWIGIITALIVVVIVLFLQAFFFGAVRRENRLKVESTTSLELLKTRAEQQDRLNSYRWIDQSKGTVGIPIQAGMDLVLSAPNAWPGPNLLPAPSAAPATPAGGKPAAEAPAHPGGSHDSPRDASPQGGKP
jgi:hypothetical protein